LFNQDQLHSASTNASGHSSLLLSTTITSNKHMVLYAELLAAKMIQAQGNH